MKALHNTPNIIANPDKIGMKKSLAQTWHARIGFRSTDTIIFTKQDHMPVPSRQGRPWPRPACQTAGRLCSSQ